MITRFAPSPTGPLHLGHAYSALTVWKVAKEFGGTALLRIEDTDSTRVRPEHTQSILEDLAWLGLSWPEPVRHQSAHYSAYESVLARLADAELVYPCSCTRREIVDAGAVPGFDGMVYPGICRNRPMSDALPGEGVRLNIAKALEYVDQPLRCIEQNSGNDQIVPISDEILLTQIGDPILRRKDTGDPSYHLACVHDDALQRITHVVRGEDLKELTPVHVLMQTVLGYPTPIYHHHSLVLDKDGKRLAKIDKSKALAKYRAEGLSPEDIKAMIGWPA